MPTYRPRNDFVLVRVKKATERGLMMPDQAAQGKRYVVEAIGPEVEDLAVGEMVLMIGTEGENWGYLPNDHDLIIIKQASIALITGREGDESDGS